MTKAECEAVAVDSAKMAADARELLKKKEDEQRARAFDEEPTPLKIMAPTPPESQIDDVFGALATG